MNAKWDHEIEWTEPPTKVTLPMYDALKEALAAAAEAMRGNALMVRVASIRPDDGSGWLCFETGDTYDPCFVEDDGEDGDVIEVRFGWGIPGCVERLPEFDGW